MISFKKVFSFVSVQFIFSLVAYSLSFIYKKPNSRSGRFSAIFSCKNFIILALTFKFLTYLELIFTYDMHYRPKFIL